MNGWINLYSVDEGCSAINTRTGRYMFKCSTSTCTSKVHVHVCALVHVHVQVHIHDVIRDVERKKERKTPEAMEK